jgi:hypothetical protein
MNFRNYAWARKFSKNTRNYERKLLRVGRNYDVDVYEITHFYIIHNNQDIYLFEWHIVNFGFYK